MLYKNQKLPTKKLTTLFFMVAYILKVCCKNVGQAVPLFALMAFGIVDHANMDL